MMVRLIAFALAAMLAACNAETNQRATPEIATGFTAKSAVAAKRHMIVAANPHATQAGLAILRKGGSALDAAIAAQLVLNVVEPQSSGIGGGGFLLHYAAKNGSIEAYDGRETAPQAISPRIFLTPEGKPKKFFDAAIGGASVGVPGLIDMLEKAHKKQGALPWRDIFAPAIKIAREGFPVSERLHKLVAQDKHLKTFEAPRRYFYAPDGTPWPVGHILKNPTLADTLEAIAKNGAQAFYHGRLAKEISAAVKEAATNPGNLTPADFKNYRAKIRAPLCAPYKVWLVCGMPPPSSGGQATLQILGLLENTTFAQAAPYSAKAVHWFSEAGRLAFADRNTYLADPDFIPVPQGGLLDPAYLKERADLIDPKRSMGRATPGLPALISDNRYAPDDSSFGFSTTHISVIDAEGNAVSMTTSIENAFGSRMMVGGFLLNNQLTDFSFTPAKNGAPVANAVEPGKRPRSSMAPTLVFDASGRPVLIIGSPGGSRIIGYVAQALISILDWKMDVQTAVSKGHFQARTGATELEENSGLEVLKPELEAMGHKVDIKPMTSGLHAIHIDGQKITGGVDPRREGIALGD